MAQSNGTQANILSLPTGSAQIKPMWETFQADFYTGSGNFSIPIRCPAGINKLSPDLTLQYNTNNTTLAERIEYKFNINNETELTLAIQRDLELNQQNALVFVKKK